MKTFSKALVLTIVLIACKKQTVSDQKPLPKNYQTAIVRVQAVDENNAGTTNSQVVFITIEK